MTDAERITAYIDKLKPGGWTLPARCIAHHALKIRDPKMSDVTRVKKMMADMGHEGRRVSYGGMWVDVWDVQR